MSSLSSISSTINPYESGQQTEFGQFIQDFNSIGSALQSSDLSGAQSALAVFQQDIQGNSQTSANNPFGKNTKANTDYQNLTSALQSGDLSTAQTAFANLQKDLQGTGKSHRPHHYNSAGADGPDVAASTGGTTSSGAGASEVRRSRLDVTG